jgi:molybdopterin/thiamine biosynthesis adenylyltransferase
MEKSSEFGVQSSEIVQNSSLNSELRTLNSQRRYARHILLPEIGEAGQQKLLDASVLIIGAGGLGSAVIAYLAAGGIGRLGVIDHDHVELSNLQRQIIHEHGDVGRLKVESAGDRISEINPDCAVDLYPRRITQENAASIISRYDIVADGCDHFGTRLIVNAACRKAGIPLVSAAVKGFDGQLMTIAADANAPCYQCLVSELPPEAGCRETGVIGPLCGVMGALQALEVMKMILGLPTLSGQLLRYDGRTHRQRISTLIRAPECPCH